MCFEALESTELLLIFGKAVLFGAMATMASNGQRQTMASFSGVPV